MRWVTIIWAMIASACLMLALVHFCRRREAWANLLFSVMAVASAVFAGCELWMMHQDLHHASPHQGNKEARKVLEGLRRSQQRARLVFLTVHEDADYARAALDAGGLGYVVKARLASDLLPAIRAALADRPFISPPVRLDEARPTSPDLPGKPPPTERKP